MLFSGCLFVTCQTRTFGQTLLEATCNALATYNDAAQNTSKVYKISDGQGYPIKNVIRKFNALKICMCTVVCIPCTVIIKAKNAHDDISIK